MSQARNDPGRPEAEDDSLLVLRDAQDGRPALLVIGSHPDDETMFAGGTLAWAARAGLRVELCSVTRGEGGECGEPPVATQDRLGEAREAELRCAAQALGAGGVIFLPYVDPLVEAAGPDPAPPSALFRIECEPEAFERALVEVIRRVRADVLLTHGSNGEYGHPQHLYTHETVRRAFDSAGDPAAFPDAGHALAPVALYSWAAYYPTGGDEFLERLLNQDDPADWTLDLTPELLDVKERAALCHRSQHALFRRRRQAATVREVLLTRESLRRQALREGATSDPLADALAGAREATRMDADGASGPGVER